MKPLVLRTQAAREEGTSLLGLRYMLTFEGSCLLLPQCCHTGVVGEVLGEGCSFVMLAPTVFEA